MSIRNASRLLLPLLLLLLGSSSAFAAEARLTPQSSSLSVYSALDANQLPDIALTRLASINSDEDPGNVDEPGPEAVVPHYYLPTIAKTSAGLSREQHRIPFSGQSSTATLRGPPLPL